MGKSEKKSKAAAKKSTRRGKEEYSEVAMTDTDDTDVRQTPSSARKEKKSKPKSKPSKSKQKKTDEKKGKKKPLNVAESEADVDSENQLKRKPSPVVAPLPKLSKEEFRFFELVKKGEVDEVEAFLRSDKFKGMSINKTDKTGYTVLHYAVRRQDESMTRLLLAQPGIRLYDTLLHAVKEENEEITKILLAVYDASASEERKQKFVSSLHRGGDQKQIEKLKSTTSHLVIAPEVSPTSLRSGIQSSVKVAVFTAPTPNAVVTKPSRDGAFPSSSSLGSDKSVESEELPFDSEFPPVITPLMLSAQQGCTSLMELFYSRGERLENQEFTHNCGCSCDICYKLDGDQDMTRAYQRYHLFKALSQPEYICFMTRKEKIDPVNYSIQKILKLREIVELDQAYNQLFDGFEAELELFISKLLKLCRNTTETEIFLSPKDAEGKERLPHLYPRLWYAVGCNLKHFVAEPNAQNIVYKMWATDAWPDWDTYSTLYRVFNIATRVITFPLIAAILLVAQDTGIGRRLGCPVSRFLTYLGSYTCFLVLVGIQALYPYQRCNDKPPYYQIDDNHCNQRGPPNLGTEWPIIIYVMSFFVSTLKRSSVSWYWQMRWSWYDLITQACFLVTFGFWGYSWIWVQRPENQDMIMAVDRLMWPHDCAEIFGECFLAVSFMLASGRILRFFTVLPDLGPVQIILGKQIVDFLNTMFIMVVVIAAFASGMLGLYLPYKDFHGLDHTDAKREKLQDDSYHSVIGAFKTFFFVLYEHGGPETTKLLTWNVRNESGAVEEIHHTYTEKTGLFLFLTYNMIGCTMLFSMLSGYFAQTAEEVQENIHVEWKFARTEFYLTFIKDTVLPPPINLIPTLRGFSKMAKFFKLMGSKTDPRGACSMRQCCYITGSKKTEKWKALMRGYRKLILQLIYRYINLREEEEGEEGATKDDVLEIGEELAEIKAMLKKGKGAEESSDDDDEDDDDDNFKPSRGPSGNAQASRVASPPTGPTPSGSHTDRGDGKPGGPPPPPGGGSPPSGGGSPPRQTGSPTSPSKSNMPPSGTSPPPAPQPPTSPGKPNPGSPTPSKTSPKKAAMTSVQMSETQSSEGTPTGPATSGKLSYNFVELSPPRAVGLRDSSGNTIGGNRRQSGTGNGWECYPQAPYNAPVNNYMGAVGGANNVESIFRAGPPPNPSLNYNVYRSQADHDSPLCPRVPQKFAEGVITPKMTTGLMDINDFVETGHRSPQYSVRPSRGEVRPQASSRANSAGHTGDLCIRESPNLGIFAPGRHTQFSGAFPPTPPMTTGIFDIGSPGNSRYDANFNREPIGASKVHGRQQNTYNPNLSPGVSRQNVPSTTPIRPIPLNFDSDDSRNATAGSGGS